MSVPKIQNISRRVVGSNVWFGRRPNKEALAARQIYPLNYEVLPTEAEVGRAMFEEIKETARNKDGDMVIIILGGRGAQALHKLLGELAQTDEIDSLLGRLHIFTQDALAPMRMNNGLSFVRDFERLLGEAFFRKVKSFSSMQTDAENIEQELIRYVEKLETLGGIDIFFLGLGPEKDSASHLCYIKPDAGATEADVAGMIPISSSILEHHITKFKAGGSIITDEDETECRNATEILTLGPAAILGARRIVQSIVDASTAPAKRECFARVLKTEISTDAQERATQLDDNPGLWVRLHPNVRSLVLPDLLEA